ncbi:hypothetical protein BDD12DRAFT_938698, partial [Trichophaea hybrida]
MNPRNQEEHRAKYQEYADLPEDTPQERRAKAAAAQAIEKEYNIRSFPNVFFDYPFVDAYGLHRPDLLHMMYLGMIRHIMEWIESFLRFHSRLGDFDAIWRTIPRYTSQRNFNKPYRQITQLQGRDYRYIGKIIYPVLAASLNNPHPSQRKPFRDAIQCTRALVSFGFTAQYRWQDETTIGNLQTYLRDFHRHKHAMKEAYDKVISDGGDFDFVKIHLLAHFEEAIRAIGNLPSHSSDCSEKCHKIMLKDAMPHCNYVTVFQKQILNYNDRLHSLNLRALN